MKLWEAVLIAAGLRDLPLIDDDTEYPPFKLDSACPKCGFNGVEKNHDGHTAVFVPGCTEVRGVFRVSFPERMRRWCNRCSVVWFELPVDASKGAN